MTFRIQRIEDALFIEGLVDEVALGSVTAELGTRRRIVFGRGTEVDAACIDGLVALGVELVAEGPFLTRVLAERLSKPSP